MTRAGRYGRAALDRRNAARGSVSLRGSSLERLAAKLRPTGTTPAAWLEAEVDKVAPPTAPPPAWCGGAGAVLLEVDRQRRAVCPKCGRLIGTTQIGRATKTPQRYRLLSHREGAR